MCAKAIASETVRLKNGTSQVQEAWLEPLGDRFLMQAGWLYEFTVREDFGKVEVDQNNGGFVVYGWVTRISSIDEHGDAHVEWELPQDEAPDGMQRPA